MNPVPAMQLVELIWGTATSEETFAACKSLVSQLGKTASVSEDSPAFIVNRILIPMINESCYVLYEGVGNVASIDASMRLGANHPMGPLQLADLIGLDTCVAIMQVLNKGLGDPKYRPCPLLVSYVEAGWVSRLSSYGLKETERETTRAAPPGTALSTSLKLEIRFWQHPLQKTDFCRKDVIPMSDVSRVNTTN